MKKNPAGINSAIKILLLFIFLFNLSASLYVPIIAFYITGHIPFATLTVLGISLAIYSVTKSIFQIPIAKRLDSQKGERDDFYFMLVGIFLAILYCLSFMVITTVTHLYVVEVLVGIADACIMASFYAIFSHHIDKDSQGFEWSLFSVGGMTVSAAIGGVIGGYVATEYGFATVFVFAALFNALAMVLLLLLFPYVKNFRLPSHYKKLKVNSD